MASITVRNIDEHVKARLRVRAATHGRSMEDEVREILKSALAEQASPSSNLAEAIRQRFQAVGGIDLPEPEREPLRQPPRFD